MVRVRYDTGMGSLLTKNIRSSMGDSPEVSFLALAGSMQICGKEMCEGEWETLVEIELHDINIRGVILLVLKLVY